MLQSNFSLFRKVLRGESSAEYFMPTVYVSVKVRKVKKLNSNARFMHAKIPRRQRFTIYATGCALVPRWLQHLAFYELLSMHLLPCALRWKIRQMGGNKLCSLNYISVVCLIYEHHRKSFVAVFVCHIKQHSETDYGDYLRRLIEKL